MAVGDVKWPQMHPVDGVRLGATAANIKYQDRNDVVLISVEEGSAVSAVFTQNAFCAAPVILGREHVAHGGVRYLIVNSGNANACTGERGLRDANQVCQAVADLGGALSRQVLPFSTGVIGEFLPSDKIIAALPDAQSALGLDGWQAAARAIMTTDTVPKGASQQFEYDAEQITVTGIAKGAGMIRPDMATMLAFVATDAVVSQTVLDHLVKRAADRSFNRISVDGDTSTNDACVLIASGQAGLPMITAAAGDLYEKLELAVTNVMQALAQSIIRDAEGATKFVTVEVRGGASAKECLRVAYSIAHSPLVKTAMFAADANWGRIVCAIGNARVSNLEIAKVKMWLDDVLVVDGGARASSYEESLGASVVAKPEFTIRVDLARGAFEEVVWTSDLSHEYVNINAEYRT